MKQKYLLSFNAEPALSTQFYSVEEMAGTEVKTGE